MVNPRLQTQLAEYNSHFMCDLTKNVFLGDKASNVRHIALNLIRSNLTYHGYWSVTVAKRGAKTILVGVIVDRGTKLTYLALHLHLWYMSLTLTIQRNI